MIEMCGRIGWMSRAETPKWRKGKSSAAWHGVSECEACSCRVLCFATTNSHQFVCSRRAAMASGLDDLLSGLPGFSKPSMKELKQQGRGTSSTPLQANAAASRSPAATGTASPLRPPQAPGTSPAAVPFGMDQLDHLVKSQSSPALAAQRCAYPPAARPPPLYLWHPSLCLHCLACKNSRESSSEYACLPRRASANSASSGSLGGLGSAGGRPTAAGGAAPPTPPGALAGLACRYTAATQKLPQNW